MQEWVYTGVSMEAVERDSVKHLSLDVKNMEPVCVVRVWVGGVGGKGVGGCAGVGVRVRVRVRVRACVCVCLCVCELICLPACLSVGR